jgi:hypothetical protein
MHRLSDVLRNESDLNFLVMVLVVPTDVLFCNVLKVESADKSGN